MQRRKLDWREREFVSYTEAARIAGRTSWNWTDDQVTAGYLAAFHLPSGGPPVVSVASLARLLDGAEPLPFPSRGRPGWRPRIVSNE